MKILPAKAQVFYLEGPIEALQFVSAIVKKGRLIITTTYHADKAPAKILLKTDRLDYLRYKGTASLTMSGIRSPHFEMDLNTEAKVNITNVNALHLVRLTLNGSGEICIDKLNSQHINIDSQGADHLKIIGNFALDKLRFGGKSDSHLMGVHSDQLTIIGDGSGQATLTGHANQLKAILHDDIQLNLKKLPVNKSFVESRDFAHIALYSLDEQNILTRDHSHVYYFNRPILQGIHRTEEGDVIYMGDLTEK